MKKLFYYAIVIILPIISSCTKDKLKNDYKKSGFNSPSEFLDNPDIQKVIKESGLTIYEGTNPPQIEGEYRTDECNVVAASQNLSQLVGLPLGSTFKFSNQTSDLIEVSETGDNGEYAQGMGAFITGNGNNFTLWIEAHQSSGADVVALQSGSILDNGDIDVDNVTLYTNNPPQDIVIGDWWESVGPFKGKTTDLEITVYYDGTSNVVENCWVHLFTNLDDWNYWTNTVAEGYTDYNGMITFSDLQPIIYYVDTYMEGYTGSDYYSNWNLNYMTNTLVAKEVNSYNFYIEYTAKKSGSQSSKLMRVEPIYKNPEKIAVDPDLKKAGIMLK